jgi:hypothetical protein
MPWTKVAELQAPPNEFRLSGGFIQWRVEESGAPWQNMVPLSAIQGLPGTNAVPSVDAVAAYVSAAISNAAQAAMDARFAGKGDVALNRAAVMNLESFPGVFSDGVTECGAAIQAALDAASAAGVQLISKYAHYVHSSTIYIRDNVDLSRAVFDYTGTGTAVVVGNPPENISRKTIRTPYVYAVAKTNLGWAQVANAIGVKVVNTFDCTIYVGQIHNFGTGFQARGEGTDHGVTYCNFYFSHLLNNKRQIHVTGEGFGYANQNQTYGGTVNYAAAEGIAAPGTRHVLMDTLAAPIDGWTFHQLSLEDSGGVAEYTIEAGGNNNVFDRCRFETAVGVPKVLWSAGSYDNEILGGVNVDAIVETVAAGSRNHITRIPGTKVLTASKVLNGADEGKTIIANGATPLTFTLPSAAQRSPGTMVTIKNVAASTVTVNTTTDPLDGGFTAGLAQWQSKTFMAQHSPDLRWVTVS